MVFIQGDGNHFFAIAASLNMAFEKVMPKAAAPQLYDIRLERILLLKRLLLFCMLCIPFAAGAFVKPMKVVAPELVGLSCISDSICTDDVSHFQEVAALYDEAVLFVDSTNRRRNL